MKGQNQRLREAREQEQTDRIVSESFKECNYYVKQAVDIVEQSKKDRENPPNMLSYIWPTLLVLGLIMICVGTYSYKHG